MRHIEKASSALFFRYNTALGPPYQVLVDTNFINFSIRNKIDLVRGMMECLYAKCTPCITDCGKTEPVPQLCQPHETMPMMATIAAIADPRPSRRAPSPPSLSRVPVPTSRLHGSCPSAVMAELEKLGAKYRVALKIAKNPRFERLPCAHRGTYADDCLVDRVTQHKCYMVATCDKDLRRRIRKIPGIPIMYIQAHKYSIERLPEATMGGAPR